MEKPVIKDRAALAYVEYLENKLSIFEKSPYVNTYTAIRLQVEDWNIQLREKKIDLFADKEAKEFERAFKYFMEASDVLDRLDKMRGKMTADEIKDLNKKIMLSEDSAENYLRK